MLRHCESTTIYNILVCITVFLSIIKRTKDSTENILECCSIRTKNRFLLPYNIFCLHKNKRMRFFIAIVPDFDECKTSTHSCDDNAACKNTVGSYTCSCKSGYSGDGKTCNGKMI